MSADLHIVEPQTFDQYEKSVRCVAEYLRQRLMRGRDLRGMIFDAACQFPGLKLGTFNDALADVYTNAGSDAFPTGRRQ